jgi:glycogen debranching enzyme
VDSEAFLDSTALVRTACSQAMDVVAGNRSDAGLRAASSAYPEVWARDSVITCLGLLAAGVPTGVELLRNSLRSLQACQSRLGRIPNHVLHVLPGRELQADTLFAGAVAASACPPLRCSGRSAMPLPSACIISLDHSSG